MMVMWTVIQWALCRWQIDGHYIQLLTIKDGLTASQPPQENISPLSQEQIQCNVVRVFFIDSLQRFTSCVASKTVQNLVGSN